MLFERSCSRCHRHRRILRSLISARRVYKVSTQLNQPSLRFCAADFSPSYLTVLQNSDVIFFFLLLVFQVAISCANCLIFSLHLVLVSCTSCIVFLMRYTFSNLSPAGRLTQRGRLLLFYMVTCRDKTHPRVQKYAPESKNTSQYPKHAPESKTGPRF